jgi:hypothetical protein
MFDAPRCPVRCLLPAAALAVSLVLLVAGVCSSRAADGGSGGGSGCSVRRSGQPAVRADGKARVLVPTRGVVGARLCRYFGRNHAPGAGPAFTLASSPRLGERAARELAGEFDRLRAVTSVARKCPLDEGGRLFVRFAYRDRRPVLVEVSLSGCIDAVSDRVGRAFEVESGLRKQLERLAPS